MKIHAIKHDIKTALWCGPAALAAVTGKPTSEIMAVARRCSGRQTIKGMSNQLLRTVAHSLGYTLHRVPDVAGPIKPTLAAWLRNNKNTYADVPVIVNVTDHYVTVSGRMFIDNHTKTPVRLRKAPYRRSRVQLAYAVLPNESWSKAAANYCIPPKPAPPSERTEARRIARKFGIEIEMEEFTDAGAYQQPRFVYAPEDLATPELDPHDDDHCVSTWTTALNRVRHYARLATTLPCLAEQ